LDQSEYNIIRQTLKKDLMLFLPPAPADPPPEMRQGQGHSSSRVVLKGNKD